MEFQGNNCRDQFIRENAELYVLNCGMSYEEAIRRASADFDRDIASLTNLRKSDEVFVNGNRSRVMERV